MAAGRDTGGPGCGRPHAVNRILGRRPHLFFGRLLPSRLRLCIPPCALLLAHERLAATSILMVNSMPKLVHLVLVGKRRVLVRVRGGARVDRRCLDAPA